MPLLSGFWEGLEASYVAEIYNSICYLSTRRTSRIGLLTSFLVQTSSFGTVAQMALFDRFHYIVFGLPRFVHHVRFYASCALSPDVPTFFSVSICAGFTPYPSMRV